MDIWSSRFEPVLIAALEQRDAYTALHCQRVGILAAALGQACALSDDDIAALAVAAQLHDVGKVGLPDRILLKEGPLDADEWAIMKTHSVRGEAIIRADRGLPFQNEIALAVRHHHEHYDGRGYPDGLTGHTIPQLSRIISIVDSYDAMTTRRRNSPARSHGETISILMSERGIKHDPQILDLFLAFDADWLSGLNTAGMT